MYIIHCDFPGGRAKDHHRQLPPPDIPGHRSNVRAVSGRWRTLTPEQYAAWRMAAANNAFVTETGRRVCPTGYNFFVSLNTRRADLDLPQFDLPPAKPVFSSIWIRTCQHIDGWTDVPKVARARVPAPAA